MVHLSLRIGTEEQNYSGLGLCAWLLHKVQDKELDQTRICTLVSGQEMKIIVSVPHESFGSGHNYESWLED